MIYIYLFGVGYLMSTFMNFFYGYQTIGRNETVYIMIINYLLAVIAYKIARSVLPKRTYPIVLNITRFSYTTSSLALLTVGVMLVFNRLYQMGFKPFWVYGGVPITESGLVGVGLTVLSIASGLDCLYLFSRKSSNSKIFILLLFIAKFSILVLFGRSRSLFLWLGIMFVYFLVIMGIGNHRFRTILFMFIIIAFLSMMFYRILLIKSKIDDPVLISRITLASLAPEFRDFSNFINKYDPNSNTETGKRILGNMIATLLPDEVWQFLGVNKYEIGLFNRGSLFHSILFGSQNSTVGVRITYFGEMYIVNGIYGIFLGTLIISTLLGLLSKYNYSLFTWLMTINLAISQFNGLNVITLRIIPILIVVLIAEFNWAVAIKELYYKSGHTLGGQNERLSAIGRESAGV